MFCNLLISTHHKMIYNRNLCVAGLFVKEYAWLYAPLSLIYSTAGWQSNKRMSMGDLTSTNIPIIILLKHPISVCNPSGPQWQSGPTAHKNHSRFNIQKKNTRARVTRENKEDMETAFNVSSLAILSLLVTNKV